MNENESQFRDREALLELRQYMSDNVAPLMFADSASWLIERDPENVAAFVRSWAGAQTSRGGSASVADYMYHAVKKIYMLGDLNLLPQQALVRYLQQLARLLLEGCPPGERESLRESLSRLGDAEDILAAPVEFIHRTGGAATGPLQKPEQGAAARPDYSKEISDVLGRFDVLLSRIEERGRTTPAAGDKDTDGSSLTAHALAAAAESAQTAADLKRHLERLGLAAASVNDQSVIRTLGDNLPDWAVAFSAPTAAAGGSPVVGGRSDSLLGAMGRVVALAEDQPERAARFGEVVENAVRQFNEDHLGRAVSMIDVARELIARRQVEEAIWRPVRQGGHTAIDQKKLRAAADDHDRHLLLRRFIDFFDRLTVDGLLEDLRVERARDRRRMQITLLECYGAEARPAIMRALEATAHDPEQQNNWYFRRNLLYLLHSIPLAPGESHSDKEVSAFIDFSALGHPVQVIREALSNLALIEPQRAERMLQVRLREYEQALTNNQRDFDAGELRSLLDRAMSVLIRTPTPGAQRAAIEHGLRDHEALGDTHERLIELGEYDLSNNEPAVERLLQALNKELPSRGVLGLFARKTDSARAANFVRALGGTAAASHPAVRGAFENIVEKHAATDFGRAAEEILRKVSAQPAPEVVPPAAAASNSAEDTDAALLAAIDAADPLAPAPSPAPPPAKKPARPTAAPAGTLNGDLSLFGLPNLMQNLADSRLSGNLRLLDQEGATVGTIALQEGRILSSSARHLQGVDAIYQLLEKPFPGTFEFSRRAEGEEAGEVTDDSLDLISVLLEGMRRYDELLMSSEVIPDDAQLTPTGVEPTAPEDENDMSLVQKVWALISVGTTPIDCEGKVTCDSYRVRRLLSHWLENKAVRLAPAAA